LTEQVMMS